MTEIDRINFLKETQGEIVTYEFVKRTYNIYKASLRNKKHHANKPLFRRSFVESCIIFRKYLKEHHA